MNNIFYLVFAVLICVQSVAQKVDSTYMAEHYNKATYSIPMRDGVELYTIVYTPKAKGNYPFLMNRTCYNASRNDDFKIGAQPSPYLVRDLYILVYQDVRGRYMSGGIFDNMRPNIPGNKKTDIDESSDTYDTIDWLIKNIKNNNGKAGIYGISYPGFYSAASLPDAHPALKAVSPQAPISDFFFDDFHHHGAYLMSYTPAFAVFGYQKTENTKIPWYTKELSRVFALDVPDAYSFYLGMGPLKNVTEKFHHDNFFGIRLLNIPTMMNFGKNDQFYRI